MVRERCMHHLRSRKLHVNMRVVQQLGFALKLTLLLQHIKTWNPSPSLRTTKKTLGTRLACVPVRGSSVFIDTPPQ
jgi:hypothetical protein